MRENQQKSLRLKIINYDARGSHDESLKIFFNKTGTKRHGN